MPLACVELAFHLTRRSLAHVAAFRSRQCPRHRCAAELARVVRRHDAQPEGELAIEQQDRHVKIWHPWHFQAPASMERPQPPRRNSPQSLHVRLSAKELVPRWVIIARGWRQTMLQGTAALPLFDVWATGFEMEWHSNMLLKVSKIIFMWHAQYFCCAFRKWIALFVAGAALWRDLSDGGLGRFWTDANQSRQHAARCREVNLSLERHFHRGAQGLMSIRGLANPQATTNCHSHEAHHWPKAHTRTALRPCFHTRPPNNIAWGVVAIWKNPVCFRSWRNGTFETLEVSLNKNFRNQFVEFFFRFHYVGKTNIFRYVFF